MHLNNALLVLAVVFLSSCDGVSAATNSEQIELLPHDERATRNLRAGKTSEGPISADANEERVFEDAAINRYLGLFEKWAKQGETPQGVYQYFNLGEHFERAYKSGKWRRLLKNEEYIMYRKYEKYLHLLETGGGRVDDVV